MRVANDTNSELQHFVVLNNRDGQENPPMAARTAEAIQTWLVSRLAELLAIESREIDVREPFASYGLGSTEVVSLSGDLAEWLGRQISPVLVYKYPTIETLARYVAGSPDVTEPDIQVGYARKATTEPIAIIGIGCRFPGANDPHAFWRLLRDGVDAISEVPAERFNRHAFYDANPAIPGKMNTPWGGFLEQVDQFDPHFFGISPREAARMDPQQRLLLEVAWEALADAGQVAARLVGTQTGVFIGISTNEYSRIQFNDLSRIDAYAGTGNALSIAANRISYLFDFRGPSIALDTACSSSLVAVHLACDSLRNGESTLALAGGVNLILSPAITINFTKAGVMAPDGRCKAFDAQANGYVRSEGAGVVVLKRLSRALADGDPIYAVIRGSAVNQDGRSNGLMAPNPLAQEAVLREAYRRAGVSPGHVHYVEAHGTGTFLGDPIEAKALGTVLASDRPPGRPCALGSVKTNIGHLEAAAGVAGLIKVALALKQQQIPPNLHFLEPNPHIPFTDLPLRVQTTLGPWPTESGPALAGVSSFGFGGTNVHVVLEEAPSKTAGGKENPQCEIRNPQSAYLLPLSARSPEALQSLARAYQDFLAASASTLSLHDICYTASVRRSHHDYRLAVTGTSPEQLIEGLEAFLRGETHAGLSCGRHISGRRRKLVFVFPGQGSQWFGMGRTLLQQEPVFREVMEHCDRAMRPYGDWSLLTELTATDAAQSRLNDIAIIQPALFAIQVALAALWRSWGIEPQAVVGHSMGEVAAAYVAGALSLEDAVRIICCRSRLVTRTVGQGTMVAVELSLEEARRALVNHEDRVSIAASNSPTSTVLSGEPTTLAAIVDHLQRQDIFCRQVKVDFASHSPQMDPLRAELVQALAGLQPPRPVSVPIYSTVTGTVSTGLEFAAPYWARNLREPVLFSTAVQRLLEDGHDIFLEISPHPILLSAIQQGFQHRGQEGTVLPSLRREAEEQTVMLGSLGALYTLGGSVDWSRGYPTGGQCVRLPAYPWQRERCWLETTGGDTDSQWEHVPRNGIAKHPLLGRHFQSADAGETHFWEVTLDKKALPYLDDHRIQGVALLPASAYAEMALGAAVEVFGAQPFALRDIEFRRALFLPDGAPPTLQVILSPGTNKDAAFHIYSRPGGIAQSNKVWTLHAQGKVCPQPDRGIVPFVGSEVLAEIQAQCLERVSGQDYYESLRESGVHYGPFFQSIVHLWQHDGDVLSEVRTADRPEVEFAAYQLHPALLDTCVQALGAGIAAKTRENGKHGIYLPTHIDEIQIHGRPGLHLWSHARLQKQEADAITGDVRLLDEAGRTVVETRGLRFTSLDYEAQRAGAENLDDWLYELQWESKERQEGQRALEPSSPASPGSWLIFTDSSGVGDALAAQLAVQGERSILVSRGESYEHTDSEHFRLRVDQPEDIRRLCEAALASEQPRCRGIVHLWSLDVALPEETTVASLHTAQTLGCGSALQLLQELVRTESRNLPRLWLVTRGAQAAGAEPSLLAVAQAPLWGLGRVIAQEHPTLWGGLVDLEPRASLRDAAAQLWEEISSPDGEDQLVFRQGRRHVARLVRKRQSDMPEPPFRWRPDGSYLISGGLGALGLAVARWMIGQGARRLILLGRTQLPPRVRWNSLEPGSPFAQQITAIRELEALGASIHPAAVDVADEGQLRAFLDEFRAEGWPPIRGVVHAAGVLRDRLLMQLDAAALTTVLRPKVVGGWLLHRLLEDAPLDFFVLFSSAGSLLGQPGQGNYAAANAFLDILAHHRRAQGQPALSINWGAWAELGFAGTPGGQLLATRVARLGIRSIAPEQGLAVLDRLLRQDSTQVMMVPVNWRQYRQLYPAGSESPLLSQLAHEEADIPRQAGHPGEKREALLTAAPGERHQLLQSYLSEQVARVLGLSAAKVDVEQPLSNLGLDSLMAVELKNRIAVDLGVDVPMVKFLQGFSVAQAATQLLDQLITEAATPSPALTATPRQEERKSDSPDEQLLANLDQLSDEEVATLLTAMLAEEKGSA